MKLNSRETYGYGAKMRTRRRFPPAGVVAILFIAATLCGAYFGS